MEAVLAAEKQYLDIAEKRNINYPHVEKALDIVQKFIRERQRILYGGMAIDLNLKSAGHAGIYAETAIPDYDIMSPEFYQDSLDLADILHKAGLPGVSAINALHITGRRVRVNYVTVCDMSYMPPDIYARIPTRTIQNLSKYKGLRVVSPDFQRLDMHRAFSHPYENAPQEVIRQRFAKDQKRFKLLDAQFPMTIRSESEPSKGGSSKAMKPRLAPSMTWKEVEGQALTGFAAYAILRKYLEYLLTKESPISGLTIRVPDERKKEMRDMLDKIPRHDIRFSETGFELEWGLPMRPRISILSTEYEELLRKLNPMGGELKHPQRYYNRFLDNLRPRAVRFFWFDYDHPEAAKLRALEGDTYEMSRNIRDTVRSFQELQRRYNLKVSMEIDKLAEEVEELPRKMDPDVISVWQNVMETLWHKVQEDIEISSPVSQAVRRNLEFLKPVPSGKMPKEVPEVEVLDVFGSLVPVFSVKDSFQVLGEMCKLPKDIAPKIKAMPERVWITQPQYLLMHFLVNAYERPKYAHIYREYYVNTARMVQIAEMLAVTLFQSIPDVSGDPKAWSVYRNIPFFLGTQTLGTINQNYNLGHVAAMRDKLLVIQGLPSQSAVLRPPFGYYPERERPHVPFDVSTSPLFQLDGKRCPESQFDSLAMKVIVPAVIAQNSVEEAPEDVEHSDSEQPEKSINTMSRVNHDDSD